MEQTETSPGAENVARRQCLHCKVDLPHTVEYFPSILGKAHGSVCRTCTRTKKRAYDSKYQRQRIAERTKKVDTASAPSTPPASGEMAAAGAAVPPTGLPARQLEVSHALRVGAKLVNEAAPRILATILEYAMNPKHPSHEWALKLVADRVIPKKLYEDLGAQAAGMKVGQGTVRPAVTIIVQQAAPTSPDSSPVRVIDVTPDEVPLDRK